MCRALLFIFFDPSSPSATENYKKERNACHGTLFKLAIDELEAFDYEEYKKNGFKVNKLGDYDLTLDFDKKPE